MSEEFCQDTFLAAQEVMGDKINYVIEQYIESANKYIDEIKSGLKEGDFTKIEDASHPLASSSAMLGVVGFADMVREIEHISMEKNEENLQKLEKLISRISDGFNRAKELLKNAA